MLFKQYRIRKTAEKLTHFEHKADIAQKVIQASTKSPLYLIKELIKYNGEVGTLKARLSAYKDEETQQ